MNFEDRFWSKVEKTDTCWLWSAARDKKTGYGRFKLNGKSRMAYDVAYELVKGSVPVGLELDHLCRNPPCVNPDHLEPVTRRVNALRGISPAIQIYLTGKCSRGHVMEGYNIKPRKNGERVCRQCDSLHTRTWKRKNRSRVLAYDKMYYRTKRKPRKSGRVDEGIRLESGKG